MRGAKSTIALVVLLGGLGAYFYFVTSKLPEGGDTAKKQDKVFAALDATKIEEIKVTSAAGEATTITSALAAAEISRVIDENPSNLNEYGLSNPRIAVDFKVAGEKDYRK